MKSPLVSLCLLVGLALASPQSPTKPPTIPPKGVPGLVCQKPTAASPTIEECLKAFKSIPPDTNPTPGPIKCLAVFKTWNVWAVAGSCQLATWSTKGDAHCIPKKEFLPVLKTVLDKCADPTQKKVEGYASLGLGDTKADSGERGVWVLGGGSPI